MMKMRTELLSTSVVLAYPEMLVVFYVNHENENKIAQHLCSSIYSQVLIYRT